MATTRIKIYRKELDIQGSRLLGKSPAVKKLANDMFAGIFKKAKRAMMREFDRHPVTAELVAGPRAVNFSDTLGGYGNLFSFIGFKNGDEPTQDLRLLLEIATTFRQTVYRDRAWYFQVSTPTKRAIEGVTRMPWEEGNSWATGVEKGISGLSHYMFKRWASGRSGYGFQLPYDNLEDSVFKTQPYMTEILANFRERINNRNV